MFRHMLRAIAPELSGILALAHVSEIIRFHRIQASPGYRQAARYCADALASVGLAPETLSYAADPAARYWTYRLFEEWHCDSAELHIVSPEKSRGRLASFAECKLSLIQRSAPTPEGGVTADLVIIDRADEADSYEGVAVEGKIVMVTGELSRARQIAVDQHGAIGLITDQLGEVPPVRHRMDIPDALQYTSFWWTAEPQEKKCFGFVLSPKAGEDLRRLDARLKAEAAARGTPAPSIRLHARVESRLYSGAIENVTAVIPGETDEEILVVAHLCHPQWSANDNASGVAVALEVARALRQLISDGTLPRPRRSIRFLLVPEMLGTYAYLATHEADIPRMVAAVNLDMVGANQALCGATLQIERPPQSMPDFAADLMERILLDIAREGKSLSGTSTFSLFRHAVTSFSGGSDHYILSDPTVGVPCPMLAQWPDRYYHTSEDTLDKVDPEMLRKVGLLTATYAYFLASASYAEAVWLSGEMIAGFAAGIHGVAAEAFLAATEETQGAGDSSGSASPGTSDRGEAPTGTPAEVIQTAVARVDRLLRYRLQRKFADLRSLDRLLDEAGKTAYAAIRAELEPELLAIVSAEQCRMRSAARAFLAGSGSCGAPEPKAVPSTPNDKRAARTVPRRLYRGPINMRHYLTLLAPEKQDEWRAIQKEKRAAVAASTQALYWADGIRTTAAVADLLEAELGHRDVDFLLRFFDLLVELGLMTYEVA
jgi:aminopeptidase YwaD